MQVSLLIILVNDPSVILNINSYSLAISFTWLSSIFFNTCVWNLHQVWACSNLSCQEKYTHSSAHYFKKSKNPTLLKETLPWLSLFNTLRPVSKQPFMKNQVLKQVVHVKQYFLLEFYSDFRENYFTHPVLNHFDNIRNMVAVKHWKNKRVWSMHNMELFKLNNTEWGKCHIKFPIWYLYLKSWEWNLALFIASVCLKTQFLVRQGCDYCCQWYTSKIFQLNILPNYINTNWTVFLAKILENSPAYLH